MDERVVPQEIVNLAIECYSAMALEGGRGKTFAWNGKRWTCIGGTSQHLRTIEARIVEVVPTQLFKGEGARHHSYYGRRFKEGPNVWVITNNQLRLIADKPVVTTAAQEQQLELWGQA